MDKNTLIGFGLIFVLFIGYMFYTQPSKEEAARMKHVQDSIEMAKKNPIQNAPIATGATAATTKLVDTLTHKYSGAFAAAYTGSSTDKVLENEKVKITFSTKGGTIKSVELKNYKTFDRKPLMLIEAGKASSGFEFYTATNELIKTTDLYFTAETVGASSITFSATADSGGVLKQTYTLKPNDFMVDYQVKFEGLDKYINKTANSIALNWEQKLHLLEKEVKHEQPVSTIFYHYTNDDYSKLDESKTDEEVKPSTPLKWVAFKQQFFNSTLLTDGEFTDVALKQAAPKDSDELKQFSAYLMLPYKHTANETYQMHYYFGPNQYNTLKAYGNDMDKLVTLGGGIFKWVKYINRWLIIPVFNFLNQFKLNYGLIILILVILIKLLLMPLNYKTFQSAAKMRILKPELDALREKYKDDQAKFGAEQLKLNRKAGVNPLGGCLPQLLQMPVLVAMYYFFPSSIELRQQSFLWAHDLSSYDSILEFGFNIPLYGSHISLFTLLMTITTYITIFMNRNQMNMNNDPNMAAMKYMQYIFPIMFLGIFNNSSAALSYYYLLQNITSIIQQQVIQRFFINEDKLRLQIEENKKRPEKKSAFQQRLDEAYKMREQQAKTKKK